MLIDSGFKAVRYSSVKEFLHLIYEKYRGAFRIDSIELRGKITQVRKHEQASPVYAEFRLEDIQDPASSVACYITKEKITGFEQLLEEGKVVAIWGRSDFEFQHGHFRIEVTYMEEMPNQPEAEKPVVEAPKEDKPLPVRILSPEPRQSVIPAVSSEESIQKVTYSLLPFGIIRKYIVLLVAALFTLLTFLVLIQISM